MTMAEAYCVHVSVLNINITFDLYGSKDIQPSLVPRPASFLDAQRTWRPGIFSHVKGGRKDLIDHGRTGTQNSKKS